MVSEEYNHTQGCRGLEGVQRILYNQIYRWLSSGALPIYDEFCSSPGSENNFNFIQEEIKAWFYSLLQRYKPYQFQSPWKLYNEVMPEFRGLHDPLLNIQLLLHTLLYINT